MASSLFPDPLQLWRDAVTRLENDTNALATGGMKSQEVVASLNQLSAVVLSMQQMFEKVIDGYLRRANLPSRKEIIELAESLQRIESKLDRLLPAEAQGVALPRPARTRRPPAAATSAGIAPEPVPSTAPAAAKRRAPRRTKG